METSGWSRATSERGVPFYVNHADQRTSWTHPRLAAALRCIQERAYVRYAAYRMAIKCRELQRVLGLDAVQLAAVKAAFAARGLAAADAGATLDCGSAGGLLAALFEEAPERGRAELHAELALNVALAALDRRRAGAVPVTGLKLLLALLCTGRLSDRYGFVYAELAGAGDRLPAAQLTQLLEVAAALAELLGEREAFGQHLAAGTVASCLGRGAAAGAGLTRDRLMVWLLQNPQMLVWVSTMYRLTSAQDVVHSVSCGVCGTKPVVGLCYACLQCLNFCLCQECFFRGLSGSGHKAEHPLQEFCAQWNRRQKTQALLKTLWNKLSGWRDRKPATLPPAAEPVAADAAEVEDTSSSSDEDDDDLMSRTILDGNVSADPQLDSILGHLESENSLLSGELQRLRCVLPPGELLPTAHARQMRRQLQRLRALVSQRRRTEPRPRTPPAPPRPSHLQSTPMPRLSQLSPIARVPRTPAGRGGAALSPITPGSGSGGSSGDSGGGGGADSPPWPAGNRDGAGIDPETAAAAAVDAASTADNPDPLSPSRRLPELTEYSLSDLSESAPRSVDLTTTPAPAPASAAVLDAEGTLAALAAELAPLEAAAGRGPELWGGRALLATPPHQTAAELVELLADLENLCVPVR